MSVEAITDWTGSPDESRTDDNNCEVYADTGVVRQLVEIDTNYKPTRSSEHPVRLTRTQALELIVHLLEATEDTFHNARVGRLRAAAAAELLQALSEVDAALQNLREHALCDLMCDTGIE